MTDRGGIGDAYEFVGYLVDRALLTEAAAQRVTAAIEATGHALDTVLTELGLLREDMFAKEVARYLRVPFVDELATQADQVCCAALGSEFLSLKAILPLKGEHAGNICFAVADPFDRDTLAMIEYHLEQQLDICLAVRSAIATTLAILTQHEDGTNPTSEHSIAGAYEGDLERLRDFAQQAPIVRLVSRIAQTAFDESATDIHFEPFEHSLRIRIRVDGDLKLVETVSADLLPGIATRIKILSSLDISERRLPQDGRMRLAVRGQEIDMRVSIVPTIHGETIVLRILDRSTVALDLPALGFHPDATSQLMHLANTPNGIFLVTGPTGSGKTTTLYALISVLNNPDLKIFTVEDPVEYRMNGVTQLQTNAATGLTFARALRSVLRQDPDVILVGEIRDRETAEIAMQAALTGHLVFSTLHTNSAVGAITRLRDMGIENYLIGATVKCIIGQRLLRKRCGCQSSGSPEVCRKCNGTGHKGRTVTYETAQISSDLAGHISSGAAEEVILRELMKSGFTPMEQHAMKLAKDGVTSLSEIARVVRLNLDETP